MSTLKCYIRKRTAPSESVIPDFYYSVGNNDTLEFYTTPKGIITNCTYCVIHTVIILHS